jgi:hypothetical protein
MRRTADIWLLQHRISGDCRAQICRPSRGADQPDKCLSALREGEYGFAICPWGYAEGPQEPPVEVALISEADLDGGIGDGPAVQQQRAGRAQP